MIVSVITPPEPLVSWEEAQAHLKLDDDFEQTYVEGLIAAASAWIDGPAGWLGRSLGQQTLEARASSFGGEAFDLAIGPVLTTPTITYLDPAGDEQTLGAEVYEFILPTTLRLRPDCSWPRVLDHPQAVRVRFEAGYAEVPAPIRQAVLLIVGHWFRSREAVVVGTISSTLPLGAEVLLSSFRRWS